jgi:hypothetical protein
MVVRVSSHKNSDSADFTRIQTKLIVLIVPAVVRKP